MEDIQSSIGRLMDATVARAILGSCFRNTNTDTESCSKQGLLKMKAGTVPKAQRGGGWGWPTGPEVLGFISRVHSILQVTPS